MRAIIFGILTVTVIIYAGQVAAEPPARPAFDPGLRLKWPGSPREDTTITPGELGEIKSYHAIHTSKGPGVVVYSAAVVEFPQAVLKNLCPKELLAADVFASQEHEISRKEIEHGPAKLHGLDILMRRDGRVTRKVVVAAGRRVYAVTVAAKGDDLPDTVEVKEFIGSLAVGK